MAKGDIPELALAIKACQDNGWNKAAFILGKAWAEEIKSGRKSRKKPGETPNGETPTAKQ